MATWITDDNGNRASVEYWGSETAARESLGTLTDCINCTNCTNCTDCTDCSDCTRCTNCTDCSDCTRCTNCAGCTGCTYCTRCTNCAGCTGCMGCDLTLVNHRVPISDPRGYTWFAIAENNTWRIRAGCRNFSIAEAREHWLSPSYEGPQEVTETIATALDWIETKPCT